MSRYMRFWSEFEIEVTDPIAARAAALEYAEAAAGEKPGLYGLSDEEAAAWVVSRTFTEALRSAPGIKPVSSSTHSRYRDGDVYPEFAVPEMPHRRDDGTFAEGM